MVDDSVKVISRLHHIVATSRAGPHPKNIVVSADGTRVYVTGYDGSTSIISTADNTVKPLSWTGVPLKSSARTETTSSWPIAGSSAIPEATGSRSSAPTVQRLLSCRSSGTGLGASPDASWLYVSARRSSSYLDWRDSISVIDTGTYSVVDKIAAELAPDTVTVSWDGARLYATH